MDIDGEKRHYDLVISPIKSRGGDDRGKLIVLRDITKLKRREAELQEREQDLEILNRILRHDIRNEMNVVAGYADTVEHHVADEGKDQMETIQRSAETVIEITDDVRELMQAMLEESESDLESIDLASVLEKEVENARTSFEEAEITVGNELPEQTTVKATAMLSSVFTNLLTNAVAHNDKETPEIDIRAFEAGNPGDEVVVEIADNGPGVPPEKRDEIFGRGEKGLESSGTGIGLYLVDTLLEQYDGAVDIRDNEPEGAVFRVTLPKAVS